MVGTLAEPLTGTALDERSGGITLLDRTAAPAPWPGEPFRGATPCVCGGMWRYVLVGTEAQPVWRCLSCGRLDTLDVFPDGALSADEW